MLTEHRAATGHYRVVALSEEAAHQVRQTEPHFLILHGSKKGSQKIEDREDHESGCVSGGRLFRSVGERTTRLELGIGKGRIERSLAAHGIKVAGGDASSRQIRPATGPTLPAISASRLPHWWR